VNKGAVIGNEVKEMIGVGVWNRKSRNMKAIPRISFGLSEIGVILLLPMNSSPQISTLVFIL
jgi:hypothetical protein